MDPEMAQNPVVIGKLDIDEVKKIDFKPYMGYIDPAAHANPQRDAQLPAEIDYQKIQHKNFSKFYAKLKIRTE